MQRLTSDEIVKKAPSIIPNIFNQESPKQPLNEGEKEDNNEPPPSLPNAWIYDGRPDQ